MLIIINKIDIDYILITHDADIIFIYTEKKKKLRVSKK